MCNEKQSKWSGTSSPAAAMAMLLPHMLPCQGVYNLTEGICFSHTELLGTELFRNILLVLISLKTVDIIYTTMTMKSTFFCSRQHSRQHSRTNSE